MSGQAAYTVLFYLLATVAILLALAVVNARKLLRAAIGLMGVLFTSAGLYVMLQAYFLAGIQVLVYVGGIVVLIVFAVMLTRSADLLEEKPVLKRQALAALVSLSFLGVTAGVFYLQFGHAGTLTPAVPDVQAIGHGLLDQGPAGYVLPFEIISLLLLAAVLGGMVVARKTPPPAQPFTSGGDLPGEAPVTLPRSQRDTESEAAP